MKNVLKMFVFSLFAITAACQNLTLEADMSLDSLRAKVSKDPIFAEFNDALDKQVEVVATGEVNFKNVDKAYIKQHRSEAQTAEELIQVYEKAGLKNAKKYLETSNAPQLAFAKLVNKYDRLANMSVPERKAFMKSIAVPGKKLDFKETFERRASFIN